MQPNSLLWRRWEDGRIIGRTNYKPEFKRWFGAPYYVTHRAHLHELLHQKAVELGVEVFLGSTVTKYDLEKPKIQLDGEKEIEADLIVAADGESSSKLPLDWS